MIDKRPLAIVGAAGVADVIATVKFAQARGLPVAIRGGGHNVAGSAVCDDGIVIDLAPMKSVRVDPVARRARAEGGVLWREYDHETQAFGLASPGGAISTTGIAGLTLGGGFGYLSRMHGMACDNLVSADVVTAAATWLPPAKIFIPICSGACVAVAETSASSRRSSIASIRCNRRLGGLLAFPFEMAASGVEALPGGCRRSS